MLSVTKHVHSNGLKQFVGIVHSYIQIIQIGGLLHIGVVTIVGEIVIGNIGTNVALCVLHRRACKPISRFMKGFLILNADT